MLFYGSAFVKRTVSSCCIHYPASWLSANDITTFRKKVISLWKWVKSIIRRQLIVTPGQLIRKLSMTQNSQSSLLIVLKRICFWAIIDVLSLMLKRQLSYAQWMSRLVLLDWSFSLWDYYLACKLYLNILVSLMIGTSNWIFMLKFVLKNLFIMSAWVYFFF